MAILLPVGNDSFSEIRESDSYYVDKTRFIHDLLNESFKVSLFTRPRRFGKTLTMSMLEDFFDINRDSREDFAGLEISQYSELCAEWMNRYPVLFLTLKSVEGLNFEDAFGMLKVLISDYCIKNDHLCQSDKVDEEDRECFRRYASKTATAAEVKNAFYTLTRILHDYYGRRVILLIDEYDVPLATASEAGYYEEMLDVIRAMLGKVLKTNEYLKFAVITGCLKIAKESIFAGVNNLVSDTISDERFDEYFGFTGQEVEQLLADTGFEDHLDEMREWYDGYLFGKVNVYCPWDVLNHVAALRVNPKKRPQNYWEGTSHNGIIKTFISREQLEVQDKFETLMTGGHIIESLTENLTYDMLRVSKGTVYRQTADERRKPITPITNDVRETLNTDKTGTMEQNFWSLLYLTGYLTRVSEDKLKDMELSDRQAVLRIPNEEVKSIFKTAIIGWFEESVQAMDRSKLFDAFWSGNAEKAEEMISDLLFDTISYHDYQESYYHAFLAGIFAGAGYAVESNYEHGRGRPDVVVKDRKGRRALLIEAKHAKKESELEGKCEEALTQVKDKQYAAGIQKGYRSVTCYGIAFFEKECRIRKV